MVITLYFIPNENGNDKSEVFTLPSKKKVLFSNYHCDAEVT